MSPLSPTYACTMPTRILDLHRRFRPASDEDGDRRFRGLFATPSEQNPDWMSLLQKRRVVVLAEAGSGKSAEFERTCGIIRQTGAFAFSAAVRDVATSGLPGALVPADRQLFDDWKSSPDALCWLFIDSVDEAKDQGHHFDTAARFLADAIIGMEDRTHLYISGRFTDWDKTGDSASMAKWLSLPSPPPPPLDLGEEVRATLHRKDREPTTGAPEPIEVMVLEPLTRTQVRRFAVGSGIQDADALLEALEEGNLWRFAARPLDLAWMVEYWRDHRRLGTLRDMVKASVRARLLDPDVSRRRADPLEAEGAGRALYRIGAAFVLCGKVTIRVPAGGLDLSPPEQSLPLEAILPEWADGRRRLLLGRPVFDPATLGRARLHNDNEGTLRCYLAAQWLASLLAAGCPIQIIHDLLFVDLYGYRLVRPDMAEVAAWLAGTHAAIADELISRDPFALLSRGDPGSLPVPARIKAFDASLLHVDDTDHEKLWFSDDGIRRFAGAELDAHIEDWWTRAGDRVEAQHLVLRLIRIGQQGGGLPIARTVAFDQSADELTQLLAGRALARIGDVDDMRRYARHIVEHREALSRSAILNGLEALFPEHVAVDEFFQLIDHVGLMEEGGHVSVLPLDSEVAGKFGTAASLQVFLEGLLERFGDLTGDGQEHSFRDAFANIAAACASRLLDYHPDNVPDVVSDLNLFLRESRRSSWDDGTARSLSAKFSSSPGRRRTSFWRSVERLRTHPFVTDGDDMNLFFVQHLGWPVVLEDADLDWLMADIRERPQARDRLTALRGAHAYWRQNGERPEVLERLTEAASAEPELAARLAAWQVPLEESPSIRKQIADFEVVRRRNEEAAETRDRSWIDLIGSLRDDPTVFDRLSQQTAKTVDSRLFHLWQFLTWRTQSRGRYAIDDLDTVRPILGEDLTRRFGTALIAFADAHMPLGSVEDASEHRLTSNFDIIALTGTALAAGTVAGWASSITPERAAQAARLAVAELNGFPAYLVQLAVAHPQVVRTVLLKAVHAQLSRADPAAHGMLDRLEHADPALGRLIVDDLAAYLQVNAEVQVVSLERIVSALIRALPKQVEGLAELARRRAEESTDPGAAAYYLLLLFALEGDPAVDVLRAKMATLDGRSQADLCCILLPRLFGDRFNRAVNPPRALSVRRLEQLLIIAFEGVRPSEDTVRPDLVVYSPELRDEAQDARNMIFDLLRKTSGEAAHAALVRLTSMPGFPIEPKHMRIWTRRHAEADAVLTEWLPGDVVTFERSFDRAPTTTADLQLVARRRTERIQHDLIDGKYAQGDTLQGLVDEPAVQRWLAIQFEALQGEAYTLQRETHYAGEKEPDIVLTSRHSGVELPIEIKVVDELTVAQMEAALVNQLCGQYLRHASARHGILLLVYQKARLGGWNLVPGEPLAPFSAVLEHLVNQARLIREDLATGPQPIVAAIDVSEVVPMQLRRRQTRERKKSTTRY